MSRLRRLAEGAVAGVLAYALGLLYAVKSVHGSTDGSTPFIEHGGETVRLGDMEYGSAPTVLEMGTWIHLRAHFVPIDVWGEGHPLSGRTSSPELLLELGTNVEVVVFLLLAGGGFWLARRAPVDHLPETPAVGGRLVVGYLPCAYLAADAASWSHEFEWFHVKPNLLLSVLLTGFAVPLVAGTVGAALAHVLTASTDAADEADSDDAIPSAE